MPSSGHSVDLDAALKHCASEQVHTPGHIQSHGALIAVDNETLEIKYASETTVDLLRVRHDLLLGRSLNGVFSRRAQDILSQWMLPPDNSSNTSHFGRVAFGQNDVLVTSTGAGGMTLFEFEAPQKDGDHGIGALNETEPLLKKTCAASTYQELFDTSVQFLQALTGYDRVMVYSLDSENNGTVVSEATCDGYESFLGLRFPAWDIPPQARAMMLKQPLRYIADVDAKPSPLRAFDPSAADLDLTRTQLRGVSPVHLEYLRNMNVRSSLSLNIMLRGRLWGTVSLHHGVPRYPDQSLRQFCLRFAEFFNDRLEALVHKRRLSSWHKSCSDLVNPSYEKRRLAHLVNALEADGGVLIQNQHIVRFGQAPSRDKIRTLVKRHTVPDGITTTSSLLKTNPDLAALLGPEFAGMFTVRRGNAFTLVFFRLSKERLVTWAGAPEKTLEDQTGAARLRPRTSFAAHSLVAKNASLPWTAEHCCIADTVLEHGLAAQEDETRGQSIPDRSDLSGTDLYEMFNELHLNR